VTWLYKLIGPALREANTRSRQQADAGLDERIATAIEIEHSAPDSRWLDRLVRARGPYRKELYQLWLQSSTSHHPQAGDEPRAVSSA
jgi:hypothetical protein